MFDLTTYNLICSSRTPKVRRQERGFTLLEILVSLVLLVIITGGVLTTLKNTTRLTRLAQSREATLLSGQIALDRLQRELQMAYNEGLQDIRNPDKAATHFKAVEVGTGYELTFSYLESEIRTLFQRRTSGMVVAFYKIEKNKDGTFDLSRAEVPYWNADKIADAPMSLLATGILDWSFEFYNFRNDQWLKAWDYKGRDTGNFFPRAVRIMLETVDPAVPADKRKDRSIKLQTEFLVLNEIDSKTP